MDIVIRVINEKKDKFQLKTLVHIIFAFSKIDFSNNMIVDTLNEFKNYDRLKIGLSGMIQKS